MYKGPGGAAGAKGERGPRGPAGPAGVRGSAGPDGAMGAAVSTLHLYEKTFSQLHSFVEMKGNLNTVNIATFWGQGFYPYTDNSTVYFSESCAKIFHRHKS